MTPPIQFKDLSASLKTIVVFGWIALFLYSVLFLTGFIAGIVGL